MDEVALKLELVSVLAKDTASIARKGSRPYLEDAQRNIITQDIARMKMALSEVLTRLEEAEFTRRGG